eukprot:11199252-Alexandrium_andersonii.AAC.1
MSASLVGSEMCIRDRVWPTLATHPVGHRGRDGTNGPALHYHAGGPPVSYTHLTLPTICSV